MSKLKNPIMALEPSLWGTLPNELLHLVFARLPVAGIGQLRVLSKEWKRNVDCKDSEFNQVFDATSHLNMFAVLAWTYFRPDSDLKIEPAINIYDVQANKWHAYGIREARKISNYTFTIDASLVGGVSKRAWFGGADGGLVCWVSEWEWYDRYPGSFMVMNPLTKQKMLLPPLRFVRAETSNNLMIRVRMIKLTMDKETKDYKVFVVGSIANGGQGFFAKVYDSCTKEWTFVEAIHGHIIGWDYFNRDYSLCVYNCADATLYHFNETNISPEFKMQQSCCVLLEDHLFVLHKETSLDRAGLLQANEGMLQEYCISKFHLPEKTTTWVKLGVCSCGPCKIIHKPYGHINVELWGCSGFLLVHDFDSQLCWLYNLSTCEWRILPGLRERKDIEMMCRISWSAIA